MLTGIDAPCDVTPILPALVAGGYGVIGRYVSPASAVFPSKALTRAEADAIHAAGLKVLSLYEHGSPTEALYFQPGAGLLDARQAIAGARAAGQPQGSAIYFAVDYDASFGDVAGPIAGYVRDVRAELALAGYVLGLYGSGRVLGLALSGEFRWLAQSTGWAGYSPMLADVVQGPATRIGGLDVDTDEMLRASGQW